MPSKITNTTLPINPVFNINDMAIIGVKI
jgi:hypothetical protein